MANKTALITGTSTGIGTACVARLAGAGWKIYAGVRKPEDGERLVASTPGDITPLILDVTNGDHIQGTLARISSEVGSLDGLVNNAGIAVGGPVEMLTDEEWQWQMNVNFFSLVTLTREAMPLVDKAGGRFVHIGSIAGRMVAGGLGPYGASKHAVSAFNWALRAELARNTNMTSSVIEPGEIKTAIWDKGDQTLTELEARLTGPLRARYGHLIDLQRGFIAEGRTKGVDADRVAQAVEHALTARRPKARYLVGPDARIASIIALLPDRAREAMGAMGAKRWEKAGKHS